jgi:ethanolamine utilization protein EutQ (cupin superfamily)
MSKASAVLEGVTVTGVTFVRARAGMEDLKEYAGTESCELPHVALVFQGQLHVRMDDGSEQEFGAEDIMLLPPGHVRRLLARQGLLRVTRARANRDPTRVRLSAR